MSIGDMISAKLGKEARRDYEAAIRIENKRWLKHGLTLGLKLGVAMLPCDVEDGYVDAIYAKGLKK